MNVRSFLVQRLTAALMVPLIAGHLIVIFYASRSGLTAADILGRTRGSLAWGLYYAAFVALAAAHAAVGIRSVLREWAPRAVSHRERVLDLAMWATGLLLLVLGLRAVVAVVL
jgi:fumarate reductase subunit C